MSSNELTKGMVMPRVVNFEKKSYNNQYGRFIIYPFEKGVGVTIANSLRRVLLSSIDGYAITSVKFEGIQHDFESIEGVKEDITEIILALKKTNLKLVETAEKKRIHVSKKGPGQLVAADIEVDTTIEVINKDLVIANLNEDANLEIDLTIEFGRGYRSAEDIMDENSVISEIPIDAIFSPVVRVNYEIEEHREGERMDNEKVILDVWTTGALTPIDALKETSQILLKYFSFFGKFEAGDVVQEEQIDENKQETNDVYSKVIDELELSVRAFNCLKSVNINTIGDLMNYEREELMKIKNFGKKTLTEIQDKLDMYNINIKEGKDSGNVENVVKEIEEGE